jgi:hypothetical protein
VALGMAGAGAATVGGYLGGHLVFGSQVPHDSSATDRGRDGTLVDLDLSDGVSSTSAS